MIAFLRGIWRRVYMRGFTAGFRDGLTSGLMEASTGAHVEIELPDDVCAAFFAARDAVHSGDFSARMFADLNLYQTLERHLIPEETVNE
jgi:hypothetical protein